MAQRHGLDRNQTVLLVDSPPTVMVLSQEQESIWNGCGESRGADLVFLALAPLDLGLLRAIPGKWLAGECLGSGKGVSGCRRRWDKVSEAGDLPNPRGVCFDTRPPLPCYVSMPDKMLLDFVVTCLLRCVIHDRHRLGCSVGDGVNSPPRAPPSRTRRHCIPDTQKALVCAKTRLSTSQNVGSRFRA